MKYTPVKVLCVCDFCVGGSWEEVIIKSVESTIESATKDLSACFSMHIGRWSKDLKSQ